MKKCTAKLSSKVIYSDKISAVEDSNNFSSENMFDGDILFFPISNGAALNSLCYVIVRAVSHSRELFARTICANIRANSSRE